MRLTGGPKLKLMHKDKDITEIVSSMEWSGDYTQASRTLNFNVAVSPTDYFLPVIVLYMGDLIKLLDEDDNEIWQGYVFSKEKSIKSSEMSVTCYDGLIYLLKSKGTYNFNQMTPQAIVEKVAKDFNIEVGKLESGSPLDRIFDAESIYNIIMTAYTIESKKSGKLFMPKMIEGKLNVILKGEFQTKYELTSETNIIDSSFGQSIENSINKVKIYDIEGNPQGEVNIDGDFGVLQDIYKEEEGVDVQEGAKARLKAIEDTASIEALGNFECITGNAVIIREPFTGLQGLFYIDTDTHNIGNGQHIMKLGLAFEKIMDEQEAGQDPAEIEAERLRREQASGGSSSGGGSGGSNQAVLMGTGKQRVWCFLKSKGFTDQSAAGIMGNLEVESYIDPTTIQGNGRGPGRGLMQWEKGNDRYANLVARAKAKGVPWTDMDVQLEFFYHEFYNERTAVSKLRNKYKMTPDQLKGLTNISDSVRIFEDCYERARAKVLPRRTKHANEFYAKYKDSNCSPTPKGQGASATGKVGELIKAAESMLGYTYDQNRRFASNAADCSSLVLRSMAMIGLTTTKQNLTTKTIHSDPRFFEIPRNQARAGDVVWHSGHMALHIGNGTLIEASARAHKKVVYSKPGNRFNKAFRIKGLS